MLTAETKVCQNCKSSFIVDAQDFQFYEKIKVPAPTWCPECRLQRRMLWRNERFLYRTNDSHDGKEIFSAYPASSGLVIYEKSYWDSDGWDQLASGRQYDFSRSFFEQFKELLKRAPIPSRSVYNLVNSDYVNNAHDIKNCYLIFGGVNLEDCMYDENCTKSNLCLDCTLVRNSELSYQCFFNIKCSRAIFSTYCEDSSDIWFCRSCVGVSNCFGCVGLKNKSYCIWNKQCTKEEYQQKLKELNLDSYASLEKAKHAAREFWLTYPVKFREGRRNENVQGEYISNSKNVTRSYYVVDGENLKYCHYLYAGTSQKDSYDHFRFGDKTELIYDSAMIGGGGSRVKFSCLCFSSVSDIQYSFMCMSSSYLFGCVGLHHKKYCILNTQYTKEEYEELVPKIIRQMGEMPYVGKRELIYTYGDFFPVEFSPYAYNQSFVQEQFPLTKSAAHEREYAWVDTEKKNYEATLTHDKLPDRISEVPDTITQEIIGCADRGECAHGCSGVFRILPQELQFCRNLRVPLPRLCAHCRYAGRIKQRNDFRLYPRDCQCAGSASPKGMYQNLVPHFHGAGKCPNQFETSYAPERPEIVYCEQCYNSEVA